MNGRSAALRPTRLPLWLADEIEEHMLELDYLVDAQLPTETALAQTYGVSRQVVRDRSVLRRDRASFVQLMDLRRMTEVEMTAQAALNRTAADLDRMRASLEQARERLDDYTACLEADLAFHLAVAHATQNPFVLTFVQPINIVLRDVYREPIGYLATQESTLREHGAIADAIAERDPDAARAAAARHLSRIVDDAATLVPGA
jgi:GntR family transcriptional regulator, transcriptional repressor for pyruvate dehydrogenase complex